MVEFSTEIVVGVSLNFVIMMITFYFLFKHLAKSLEDKSIVHTLLIPLFIVSVTSHPFAISLIQTIVGKVNMYMMLLSVWIITGIFIIPCALHNIYLVRRKERKKRIHTAINKMLTINKEVITYFVKQESERTIKLIEEMWEQIPSEKKVEIYDKYRKNN